jgi:hypothetical protein
MVVHRAVIETGEDGTMQMTLDPVAPLSPHVLADFERHRGEPVALKFQGESVLATKLAFLAWGFLALFQKFGHSYVLGPCARTVRTALIDGRASYGEAFFLRFGDFPTQFREMSVGLAFVAREGPRGAQGQIEYIGLGVSVGEAALVCLPIGYDPDGNLIRKLENEVDRRGEIAHTLANLPFERLYERSAGRSFLGVNELFHLSDPEGALLTLVGTSRDEPEETLINARVPRVLRRRARRGPPLRPDWETEATPVPAMVPAGLWDRTLIEDLVAD